MRDDRFRKKAAVVENGSQVALAGDGPQHALIGAAVALPQKRQEVRDLRVPRS